jgi:hypothetical protein
MLCEEVTAVEAAHQSLRETATSLLASVVKHLGGGGAGGATKR